MCSLITLSQVKALDGRRRPMLSGNALALLRCNKCKLSEIYITYCNLACSAHAHASLDLRSTWYMIGKLACSGNPFCQFSSILSFHGHFNDPLWHPLLLSPCSEPVNKEISQLTRPIFFLTTSVISGPLFTFFNCLFKTRLAGLVRHFTAGLFRQFMKDPESRLHSKDRNPARTATWQVR